MTRGLRVLTWALVGLPEASARLHGARSLRITPDRPREFLDALAALRQSPAPKS